MLYRLNFKTIHLLILNLNNKKDAVPFNKKIIRNTYKLKMLKPCLHTIIRTHNRQVETLLLTYISCFIIDLKHPTEALILSFIDLVFVIT